MWIVFHHIERFFVFFFFLLVLQTGIVSPLAESVCDNIYYGTDRNGDGLSGIIHSYNYPFDYRDSTDCQTIIELYQSSRASPLSYKLCFEFRRFSVEPCESPTDQPRDYLVFTDEATGTKYQYCGDGEVFGGSGVVAPEWQHVWTQDFCWTSTSSEFLIEFHSDDMRTESGFYAAFQVTQTQNKEEKENGTLSVSDTAPCWSDWTCFNRNCVPLSTRCNGIDDCLDGSDEKYAHARCSYSSDALYPAGLTACDFEEHRGCGFMDDVLGWRMETTSTDNRRGPRLDHTVFNQHYRGFYIRTYFTSLHQASPVHFSHPTDVLLPQTEYCLSFWYHMKGHDPGGLAVYVKDKTTGNSRQMWLRTGSFGDRWLHGEIYITDHDLYGHPGYSVVFEGRPGSDWNTRLAIDDISVTEGKCMGEDVSCNFGVGYCGWDHDPVPDNMYTWIIDSSLSGESSYLSLVDSGKGIHPKGVLMSPVITYLPAARVSCLSFSYLCDMNNIALEVYKMTLKGRKNTLWSRYGCENHLTWTGVTVDVPFTNTETYQVFFEANIYTTEFFTLNLDQIVFVEGECDAISLDSCEPNQFRCTSGQCIPLHQQCDGSRDCYDDSDESEWACSGCPIGTCGSDEFCCRQGVCLNNDLVCDGQNDCSDWFDEDFCEDECREHLCPSGRCIGYEFICDGIFQCPDGSDEDRCHSSAAPGSGLSGAGVIGIVLSILVIFFLLSAKLVVWFYRKRASGGFDNFCTCPCCGRDTDDDSEPEVVDDTTEFHPPPDYQQAVDNPIYLPNHAQNRNDNDDDDQKDRPPSYTTVVRGSFLQITIPNEEELARLREHVPTVSNDENADRDAADYASVSSTCAAASTADGAYNDPGLDSRRLPLPSDNNSRSNSQINNTITAHQLAPREPPPPEYRDSWDRRTRTMPPAYDNLAYDENAGSDEEGEAVSVTVSDTRQEDVYDTIRDEESEGVYSNLAFDLSEHSDDPSHSSTLAAPSPSASSGSIVTFSRGSVASSSNTNSLPNRAESPASSLHSMSSISSSGYNPSSVRSSAQSSVSVSVPEIRLDPLELYRQYGTAPPSTCDIRRRASSDETPSESVV